MSLLHREPPTPADADAEGADDGGRHDGEPGERDLDDYIDGREAAVTYAEHAEVSHATWFDTHHEL